MKTITLQDGSAYYPANEKINHISNVLSWDYEMINTSTYISEVKMWKVEACLIIHTESGDRKYNGTALKQDLATAETIAFSRAISFAGIGVDLAVACAEEMDLSAKISDDDDLTEVFKSNINIKTLTSSEEAKKRGRPKRKLAEEKSDVPLHF